MFGQQQQRQPLRPGEGERRLVQPSLHRDRQAQVQAPQERADPVGA